MPQNWQSGIRATQAIQAQPITAYIAGRAANMAYQNDKARNKLMQEQARQLAGFNDPVQVQRRQAAMEASTALDRARAEELGRPPPPAKPQIFGSDAAGREALYQGGETIQLQPPIPGAGRAGADDGMKAADANSIRRGVAAYYGGFMDETGQLRFADPTVTKRAQAVTARAQEIFRDGGGQIPHDVAGKQALIEYGEEVVLSIEEKQGYMDKLSPSQKEEVEQARAAIAKLEASNTTGKKEKIAQIKSVLMSAGVNPSVL